MDRQTEQEVWRRVRGPGAPAAAEALLPERLEALITAERGDARMLRDLARKLRGRQAAALNALAGQTDSRVRELTALHYLLTGRRLRPQSPPVQAPGPMPEALRSACQRMRQAERAYESLADEFGDYAEDFSRGVRETRAGGRTLLTLLKTQLPAPEPR